MSGKSLKIIESSKKNHEYIIVFSKSFADYLLIGGWFIFDPERHYDPYKSPPISYKGSFVLVL
jgi:hypothetical protein